MRAADLCALGRDTSPFAFEPNALRGRKVATLVRAELADSLEAVLLALGDAIGLAGKDLIARVRAGPISPVVFGAYTELVEAVFSDDIDMASRIAAELCAPNFGCVDKLRIVTLDDVHLGVGQTARYRRLVDDDQEIGKDLRRLTEDEFAGTSKPGERCRRLARSWRAGAGGRATHARASDRAGRQTRRAAIRSLKLSALGRALSQAQASSEPR